MPRVSIIEDNPVNLELVAAVLELEGHQIVTAETAEVDLRLAAAEQPDPILMDLHLPGIDECKAARALQADPAATAIPRWPSRRRPCAATNRRPARPDVTPTSRSR
jgi:CheY-like chemotaxis protein